jgi:DNA polymerase I
VKVTFWLLDVNSETKNGTTELWLWGIDDKGNRVLVIDRNFVDYFYALVEEGFDPANVAEEIRKALAAAIVKLEVVPRRFFSKPVQTVKVYCRNPSDTAKLARTLRNFEGVKECLEDDVRLSMRYLIDNNVIPCGWHEVEGGGRKKRVRCQNRKGLRGKGTSTAARKVRGSAFTRPQLFHDLL